jgi:hypothetical protein
MGNLAVAVFNLRPAHCYPHSSLAMSVCTMLGHIHVSHLWFQRVYYIVRSVYAGA